MTDLLSLYPHEVQRAKSILKIVVASELAPIYQLLLLEICEVHGWHVLGVQKTANKFGVTTVRISQGIRTLADAGLILTDKKGRRRTVCATDRALVKAKELVACAL